MKNKIKIILYTLSLLLLSFNKAYSSEIKIDNPPEMRDSRFACKTYFEKLSKSDDNSVRNIYSSHSLIWYFIFLMRNAKTCSVYKYLNMSLLLREEKDI